MAFWSSETLTKRIPDEHLVDPYNTGNVKHSSYELRIGDEVFISSNNEGTKQVLSPGDQFTIPPGQFGLLITDEIITIPSDAIGFISIKASTKFAGLINVSGFHVDPGFQGKLKFAVYNAGSRNIVLSCGKNLFMLWFASLDTRTNMTYDGEHARQSTISDDDIMKLHGEMASPAALSERLNSLERKFEHAMNIFWGMIVTLIIAVSAGFLVSLINNYINSDTNISQTNEPNLTSPKRTTAAYEDKTLPVKTKNN